MLPALYLPGKTFDIKDKLASLAVKGAIMSVVCLSRVRVYHFR